VTVRPVVDARRLGLWLGNSWAYRDVDLVVLRGELVVLLGRDDSWRTPLIHTLALQFEPTEGTLSICGCVVPGEAEAGRRKVGLADLPSQVTADPSMRVGECVHAQLLLADLPPSTDVFAAAADVVGLEADPAATVVGLSPLEQRLLAVALTLTLPVELILLDGVDHELDAPARAELWRSLSAVSRTGAAVVVGSSSEPAWADRVVTLPEESSKFIP
jgi:ABC-2 type transport system ATP-binding protein